MTHDHNHIPMPAGASFPYVRLRGFGDLGYTAANANTGTSNFGFGQLDLFATAKFSPKLGVLVESALEADQATNEIGIDIERLLLQYHQSDFFNLDISRYHQSIGYYNTAYHHGRWFQTAVSQPYMFSFEDDGGLLPIHNVGISASGRVPSGPVAFIMFLNSVTVGLTGRLTLSRSRTAMMRTTANPSTWRYSRVHNPGQAGSWAARFTGIG